MTTQPMQKNEISTNSLIDFKPTLLSQIFTFDDKPIIVLGTPDKPFFVGKQICDILEYKNTARTLNLHIEDKWKTKYNILTSQYPLIVNYTKTVQFDFRSDTVLIDEAGLYSLIFNSKLKKAKDFRDKVFEEVLPSIRKTGEYKMTEQIKVLTQEKEKLSQEHSKLVLNHEKLLKRRNRTDYETGNVVYIISHEAFSIAYKCNYFKFGKSTQKGDETRACFKQRLSTYNTGAPVNYNVHYLLYVDNNALIEEIIKEKFSKQLDPSNKEWIKELSLETILLFIQSLMELMNISYKEVMLDPVVQCSSVRGVSLEQYTDKKSIELVETVEFETDTLDKPDFSKILEEIDKYTDKKLRVLLKEYNLTQSGLKDDKKNRLKNHILKGCTSVCEKCDENKELTELNFRKTQIGFVKVCLECEKKECEKTLLYRKHVHTEITQGVKTKVCPGCKTEKIYDDFHKNKGNKDGLVSRCKNCESSRKSVVVNVALKKVAPKVELGKKWCPKCEKIKENCNFRNAVSRPDGLQHSCKECENETRRRNRKINKL
jgi:prophage antirepressor-like protein